MVTLEFEVPRAMCATAVSSIQESKFQYCGELVFMFWIKPVLLSFPTHNAILLLPFTLSPSIVNGQSVPDARVAKLIQEQ
jgi:hypothetical protein